MKIKFFLSSLCLIVLFSATPSKADVLGVLDAVLDNDYVGGPVSDIYVNLKDAASVVRSLFGRKDPGKEKRILEKFMVLKMKYSRHESSDQEQLEELNRRAKIIEEQILMLKTEIDSEKLSVAEINERERDSERMRKQLERVNELRGQLSR